MLTNADTILFRSHAAGKLMTEARSKTELLGETTKKYLIEVFINQMYGRKKDITNKYITKGLAVEEDSLTLYSRVLKTFFTKNEKRFENEFICGTPDIILSDTVIDIKSSYDIFTFHNSKTDTANKMYYWQLQAYLALTGCKKAKLVYCLTDTPFSLLEDEKRRLMWQMNAGTEDNQDYKDACAEIDRLGIYDDIPLEDRYFEIEVERNDEDIKKLYQRIKDCREWLNVNMFKNLNQIAA